MGFIVADGCVSNSKNNYRYCLTIHINKKDEQILKDFKKHIQFDGDVWYHNQRTNMCQIRCSGKKIVEDLANLGVFERKSNIIEFPKLQKEYISHFMRGVFDGDGCVSIHHDKRDDFNRGQVNIVSASYNFIDKYVDNLVKFANVKRNKICDRKSNKYFVIDWGGLTDVENIYDFLYKDATIFLKRKKNFLIKL